MSMAVLACILLASCSTSGADDTSTTRPDPGTETTTSTTVVSPTTTSVPAFPATERFTIPVGEDGVTYDLDGDPPSGPSSFVVLADGSVVVADTMAAARGEPRLLHFDRFGVQIAVIDLVDAEVGAIVDVVRDGTGLAVLDVRVDRAIYRVLRMDLSGTVGSAIDIPEGSRFEDGLTGLASDDIGLLLEFEFGARYERLEPDAAPMAALPVFYGREIEVVSATGRDVSVRVGDTTWTVTRTTDLGGVSLVGAGPDATIVLVIDEVDTSGLAMSVTRRVERYTVLGELVSESLIDVDTQVVEIARPLEVAANGDTVYLAARGGRVEIVPEPFEGLGDGVSA